MRAALFPFLLALSLAIPRPAQAQGPNYDLMVVVVGTSPAPTQVVATYSHRVKPEALRAAAAAFSRETGRPVQGLVLQDAPLYHGAKTISSAVQFTSPGLLSSGALLPVAALMRSFPDWKHLRIAFITGQGFQFAGPSDDTVVVNGAHARLIVSASGHEYDYDVEKNPVGTPLSAAPVSPQASQAAPVERKARPLAGGIVVGLVVLSLAALIAMRLRVRAPRRLR